MSILDQTKLKAIFLILFCSLLIPNGVAQAQSARSQHDEEDRKKAYELFEAQQFLRALPLLERLAVNHPKDGGILARLGFALFARSQTIREPEKRKADRALARATLLRARALGIRDTIPADLIDSLIASVPPDGSETAENRFSEKPQAQEAMVAGETAFVNGDIDGALAFYKKALALDPDLYQAPLFAGDMYLKKQEFEKAGEWYSRAIDINPDRETAYRYWGNVLLAIEWFQEARDKYIEAIIAEPYNPYVWNNGLVRWANRKGVRLAHPKIDIPAEVFTLRDKKTTVTVSPEALDKSDDGSAAWLFYGLRRATWAMGKFAKEYPDEKEYRHSLKEEADGLRGVVEAVRQLLADGNVKKLHQDLEILLKLDDEGLLEAYVLFARVNEQIARDFLSYRKTHRDKLRKYLQDYVASGKY